MGVLVRGVGCGAKAGGAWRAHLKETVDTTHGELQTSLGGARNGLLLVALLVAGHGALGTLAGQSLRALPGHSECG